MKRSRNKKGFTLVEIMIVVLIIGILLAIAVPNFIKARETSRQKTCISNLRQVESAKEQWAMEEKKGPTDTPSWSDLIGSDKYMKPNPNTADGEPECPSGGTYTIGSVSENPTCDVSGHSL